MGWSKRSIRRDAETHRQSGIRLVGWIDLDEGEGIIFENS